jgi:hypothetical protein
MYGRYTDNKRSNYTLEIRVRKRHIHNASVQSISPIELTKETTETMKIDFYIFFQHRYRSDQQIDEVCLILSLGYFNIYK